MKKLIVLVLICLTHASARKNPLETLIDAARADSQVLIGPGVNNFYVTLMKNTTMAEKVTVQFRSEFFNGFNHPSFGDPDARVGTPQHRVINSTRLGGREIQLGLKVIF
jgi:hypothetical protein